VRIRNVYKLGTTKVDEHSSNSSALYWGGTGFQLLSNTVCVGWGLRSFSRVLPMWYRHTRSTFHNSTTPFSRQITLSLDVTSKTDQICVLNSVGFDYRKGPEFFSSPHQLWGPSIFLSSGCVERGRLLWLSEHERHYSTPFSVCIVDVWSMTFAPHYVFKAWLVIKHRNGLSVL
jgi:hypothetical protein